MSEVLRNHWYWLLLISLAGGSLIGALGVGIGILIVPALVLCLDLQQKTAQGTCLAVMVPMALMGAVRYYLNPDIKISPGVILVMIPLAVVGAYLGSLVAAALPAATLRRAFGVFVMLVGAKMLLMK